MGHLKEWDQTVPVNTLMEPYVALTLLPQNKH